MVPVWILAVKGAPGTSSLLNVMLMMWSVPSKGTKLTINLADPCGWTCVGMLRPLALMVISRFPSPNQQEKSSFSYGCLNLNGDKGEQNNSALI